MPNSQAPQSSSVINGTKLFTGTQNNDFMFDCIKRRDKMFNDIMLYSFVISKIGTFVVGIVIDLFGIFVGRCISSSMSLLGYLLLTMSIKYPFLLWIACPFMTSGGMANHMSNMPMARSIPLLSSAFQAVTAGCISGGAVVPIIWRLMRNTLSYETTFGFWLLLGSIVTITKTILFSPKRLPEKITVKGFTVMLSPEFKCFKRLI